MLRRLLSFGPELEIFDPTKNGDLRKIRSFPLFRISNRLVWGLWRHLPGTRRSRLPGVVIASLADRLVAGWIPSTDIYQGTMGTCLVSLRAATRHGAATVIDNPTLHPLQFQREVLSECARVGLSARDCDRVLPAAVIRRMGDEYEMCDRVLVCSSSAHETFQEFPYRNKTAVVLPGVDHHFFAPSHQEESADIFRACYVGRVELAKGLFYLLEAWERLALPRAELLIVGKVSPEMCVLQSKLSRADIRLAGLLSRQAVAESYRSANVLVFPSMNEGLPTVVLEAMASGVPVIAFEHTGAADCITSGTEGFLIQPRNIDMLADSILWCYRNREHLARLGEAARVRVEQQFTLAHYEQRLVSFYDSIV